MPRYQWAPQQYKQTSRKGKKAWRKYVDISDVQEGLEQLRDEIISGGPIAEKPSEEIFAVDKHGSEAVRKLLPKIVKPLKADQILAQRSMIPAVDSRKRPVSRLTDGVVESPAKKRRENWVGRKELQRLKESLNENNHLSVRRLQDGDDAAFDLWSGDKVQHTDLEYDYLEQPKSKVAPATVMHAPIAMTASGKPVKAVRTPQAGTSYNPLFTDWDDLLTQEREKALEAEKKRLQAEQLEAERAERLAATAADDLPETRTEDDSAWEGFESEFESPESLRKKRPERKSQAQRNKIKRRKEAERLALHEAKMTNRKRQARELEQLASKKGGEDSPLEVHIAVVEEGNALSDREEDDSILRRKRLRNVSIPEKNLEIVLPDELQESLRRLKPEGNLLNDRFRNLVVNGKVEQRKPILQPRKKRVTYTEKWSYKDFQIPVTI